MLTFETRCHDLQTQLQAISAGVKCVRASQSTPQLLALVLALGNVLNAGSARAGAKGFRLEVLELATSMHTLHDCLRTAPPPSAWPSPRRRRRWCA